MNYYEESFVYDQGAMHLWDKSNHKFVFSYLIWCCFDAKQHIKGYKVVGGGVAIYNL